MQNKTLKELMHQFCDIVAEELDRSAYTAIMVPIPVDLLIKADIRHNDKLTIFAEEGKLIIQAACRVECCGNCDECPVAELECDGDCENCSCRFNCDDSEVD